MEKWSREEIEKTLVWLENVSPTACNIIRHLLQQLDEAEKRVAGECAEIADTYRTPHGVNLLLTGIGIGNTIRKKYIGG